MHVILFLFSFGEGNAEARKDNMEKERRINYLISYYRYRALKCKEKVKCFRYSSLKIKFLEMQ